MDDVEDKNGVTAADYCLSITSGICTWYASRNDSYSSPIIRGMRRASTKERARDRILTDDELRAVWQTAAANGTFGAFVRVALLTGQRRDKVITMRHQDIVKGEWTIPSEKREKNTAGSLVLPQAALDIIDAQPRFAGNPYVFAGGGNRYMSGVSKRKAVFDKRAGVSGLDRPRSAPDGTIADEPRWCQARYCRTGSWSRDQGCRRDLRPAQLR